MLEPDASNRFPAAPSIQAITCFSASHKALFDKMAASFPREPGLDLAVRSVEQDGDGTFANAGWQRSTARKMEFTLEILESLPEDSLVLWVDADVVFFRPVRNDLIRLMSEARAEILFQNDRRELCTGFFIVRRNPRTIELFREVLRVQPDHRDDQVAMNSVIAGSGVRYGLLPKRYYTIGLDNPRWDGRSSLKLPKTITVFHANWTVGVVNKLKLIAVVGDRMQTPPLKTVGALPA